MTLRDLVKRSSKLKSERVRKGSVPQNRIFEDCRTPARGGRGLRGAMSASAMSRVICDYAGLTPLTNLQVVAGGPSTAACQSYFFVCACAASRPTIVHGGICRSSPRPSPAYRGRPPRYSTQQRL